MAGFSGTGGRSGGGATELKDKPAQPPKTRHVKKQLQAA